MQEAVYSTNNEKRLLIEIQHKIKAKEDGHFGAQSFVDLAIMLELNNVFPLTIKMYGCPVIVARDIVVLDPNSAVKVYENSISGSFTYPSSDKPCSVLINNGIDVFSSACHAFLGKPESVIVRYNNGSYWAGKVKTTSEIPNRSTVDWAIGGMGLGSMYNPAEEGFTGAYADVLRDTNHTVLGVKNGYCFLVYCPSMFAVEIQTAVTQKFKFDKSILLDGGHIAAINGTESFAEINMNQYQGYLIQGVK